LSLQGLGHYLPLGDESVVYLFSDRRERLPAWFRQRTWGVRIQYHSPRLFESSDPVGFSGVKHGEFPLRISAPERAILEVLHLATTNDAITHAVELMSGLSTLRPPVLQTLLEGCQSVKVKRLFLWAAESAGHDWFSRLATQRVDLGKGKRSLFRGGRFDPKYRITVPKQEEAAHGWPRLVSMKQGEPEWNVLGIAYLRQLPALQWKLQNIRRMETGKRKKALEEHRKALGM
jgi:hypothetical protein